MEKKKNNGETSTVSIQVIAIFAILFVYYIYTLLSYNATVKADTAERVIDRFYAEGDELAGIFNKNISIVSQVAQTAAGSLSDSASVLQPQNYDVLENIINSSIATYGYIADSTGNAVDMNGESLQIADNVNYNEALSGIQVISDIEPAEGGNSMISIFSPIIKKGNVLGVICLQYPAEQFETLPTTNVHDGQTIFALMKADGTIVSSLGSRKPENGSSLFDIIKDREDVVSGTAEKKIKQSIKEAKGGYVNAVIDGTERVIVYRSVGINGWYVVLMYTNFYYSRNFSSIYSPTGKAVNGLMVSLILFVAVIIVINVIDRTVNSRRREELRKKAETDLLTGLYNKIATEKYISEYIQTDGIDEPGMLFLLDIDNFKKINDTMGHAFGDVVLSTLGVKLKAQFRATDIVGRIGSDEFMVYLKKIPNDDIRKKEADVMLRFFEEFEAGDYVKYSAKASIGVAIYPDDGRTFDQLYKAADKGVYLAKQRGKNQIAFYQETNGIAPPGAK